VRRILKNLGFEYRNSEGGHDQWVRETPAPFRKVTLASHSEPFAGTIVPYMANQAGVSVAEFHAALDR